MPKALTPPWIYLLLAGLGAATASAAEPASLAVFSEALTAEGRRHFLLGATLDWREGQGTSDIALALRIGDASVVFE